MTDNLLEMMLGQMVQGIAAHTLFAREQIGKDTLSERVMATMARMPRHAFVPSELTAYAYADQPLPIGFDKTISQPFIVALMTDLLDLQPTDRVLEIGTGLGYHAAIIASLAARLYTVEIVEELAMSARSRLDELGFDNIETRIGNGEFGWPEHAPFDKIIVCAASELVPAAMLAQLTPGGRMVAPTGLSDSQNLTLVDKGLDGRIRTHEILPVRFALLETNY